MVVLCNGQDERRISSVQLYPVKHCTEFKPERLTAFIHRETWWVLRVWF